MKQKSNNGSVAEPSVRRDLLVELAADALDLALADAAAAERDAQVIDPPRAHPLDIGLLTTACSATSMRRRGASSVGKNEPVRTFGIFTVKSPAVVVSVLSRVPLRCVVRVSVRSRGSAPRLRLFTPFRKLGRLALLAAVLIGFARVVVGIRWPTDVAGGLLTGLVDAAITLGAWLLTSCQRPSTIGKPA